MRIGAGRPERDADRPAAKTAVSAGRAAPSGARNKRIRSAPLSARNTSPFGATRMVRGRSRPEAYSSTANPGGTCSVAPAGRSTTDGARATDCVAKGGGIASGAMCRTTPDASSRQSP